MSNMKKFIYALFAIPASILGACSADEGTEPGTDPSPAVTVYAYDVTDPSLNPDNDVVIRFATNNKAKEVYYLIDNENEAKEFIKSNGEDAYIKKVCDTGVKIQVDGACSKDITLTDLHGPCLVSAVASNGTPGKRSSASFVGLDWTDVINGTFYIQQAFIGIESTQAVLQICTTDKSLYRIKDAFGAGWSVKMQMLDVQGEDEDGVYTLFRIPNTLTPFKVNLQGYDTPFQLSVEDIGYWQGKASFVTDVTGYENGMYEDYTAFFRFAWMVSLGNLSFETPSFFIPN